jgi:hypothetical protein
LLLVVGLGLVLAVIPMGVVASGGDAKSHAVAVSGADPNERVLSLVALSHNESAPHAPGAGSNASYYAAVDHGFGLDTNLSHSASPSRGFSIQSRSIVCISQCQKTAVVSEIPFTGDDFQILRLENYDGVLHLAWSWHGSIPAALPPNSPAGYAQIRMRLAGEDYGAVVHPLNRTGGDLVLPLSFNHSDSCIGSQEVHNGTPCAADEGGETRSYNATDVYLTLTISSTADQIHDPLGGQLVVKVDTAGGSFLKVKAVPPPVVATPASATSEGDQPVEIVATYADTNGDPQLRFTPGPSPVFVVASIGLGLALARRLRA